MEEPAAPIVVPITFVTGNANKLAELIQLAPPSLRFTSQKIDLDEIQSLDIREVVSHKLRQAYGQLQASVIVEDVSAELASLNGLPGTFIKFFEQRLGPDALHQLSKAPNDAVAIRCLAGYFDGERLLFGEGVLKGTITAPRGQNGFGFDCVVVPDGQPDSSTRTVAEMSPDEKNAISHRSLALRSLLKQI